MNRLGFSRFVAALLAAASLFGSAETRAAEAEEVREDQLTVTQEEINAEGITVTPETQLAPDRTPQFRAWYERVLLAPFRVRAKGQPWEAAATKFVESAVFDLSSPFGTEETDFEPLLAEGNSVAKNHGNDVLVFYLLERLRFRKSGNLAGIKAMLVRLLKEHEADGTGPALLSLIGKELRNHRGREVDVAFDKRVAGWLKEALSDGSYGPEDSSVFVQQQCVAPWEWYSEWAPPQLLLPIYEKADLEEWARNTLCARVEMRLAWLARGSGFANTVTEDGWKGFREHLDKARPLLVKAWELERSQPEAATEMIGVAMAGHGGEGDSVRLWFDRAIAAQFDYARAYERLRWAYRPRWGGSLRKMLAFGRACIETKQYATRVPTKFYEVCRDLVSETGSWRDVYRSPAVAEPLLALSNALIEEPSREGEKPWRTSLLAVYAWACGDFPLLEKTLAAQPKLHPGAASFLGSFDMGERELRGEVALKASEAKAHFELAEEFYAGGDLDEAREEFEAAAAVAPPAGQAYLANRLAVVKTEQDLAQGDWVKLPTTPELRPWRALGGNWSANKEGVLLNTGREGPASIWHQARVGPSFEMRLEFEGGPPQTVSNAASASAFISRARIVGRFATSSKPVRRWALIFSTVTPRRGSLSPRASPCNLGISYSCASLAGRSPSSAMT